MTRSAKSFRSHAQTPARAVVTRAVHRETLNLGVEQDFVGLIEGACAKTPDYESCFRLYRAPEAPRYEAPGAVLAPGGELEDAATAAARTELIAIAHFVKQRAVARGGIRRENPKRAVELWKALVRGEWTIVGHVDTDGKRLLLARRNRPDVDEADALTTRERQVATYAAYGHSQKLIAYELGLSPSNVSVNLKSALKKLRLRDRAELARVMIAQR